MVKKPLIIIISIVVLAVVSIFVWLIFFSIYEVKYIYDFNPSDLNINTEYCIECVGINSLGQKISYRELDFNIILEDAEEKIELIGDNSKNIVCFKTVNTGECSFLLTSKYSLNPSPLNIQIKEL